MGAEACLLAGAARNAYHTRYREYFGADDLSCSTLRKGVFAIAALTLLSLVVLLFYYHVYSKADTGGWVKHQEEGQGRGIGMSATEFGQQRHDCGEQA